MMERLDNIFKLVCRATGEMAGALVRRRLRRNALRDWAGVLHRAAKDLEALDSEARDA